MNIDFDAYKAYRTALGRPSIVPQGVKETEVAPSAEPAGGILPVPSNMSDPPAPYPTSFAHIVELITTGQPVPGVKEIPNTVLTGQGTQPVQTKRKKPWEKGDTSAPAEKLNEGTAAR